MKNILTAFDRRHNEWIYIAFFVLMTAVRYLGFYEGSRVYTLCLVISSALFLIKIVTDRSPVREYVLPLMILLFSGGVYVLTGEKGLLIYAMMMLGVRNVSTDRVLKAGACAIALSMTCIVIPTLLGLHSDYAPIGWRSPWGMIRRSSLGYAFPNTLQMNITMLTFIVMYLAAQRSRKVLCTAAVVMAVLNGYFYLYSGGRTELVILVPFFLLLLYFRKGRLSRFDRIWIRMVYPLCAGVPCLLLFLYRMTGKILAPGSMWTRIWVAGEYAARNGIHLLSGRVVMPESTYYGIDISYLYALIQLGILPFILVSILSILTVEYCVRTERLNAIAMLVCFFIIGMAEPILFNLSFRNLTFLFAGEGFYKAMDQKIRLSRTDPIPEQEENGTSGRMSDSRKPDDGKHTPSGTQNVRLRILLQVLVPIVCAAAYMLIVEPPQYLYINKVEDDRHQQMEMEEYYLDEEEVQDLKQNGNLVVGYEDVTTPMYRLEGEPVVMEHHRRIVNTGMAGGILAAILLWGKQILHTRKHDPEA